MSPGAKLWLAGGNLSRSRVPQMMIWPQRKRQVRRERATCTKATTERRRHQEAARAGAGHKTRSSPIIREREIDG